MNLSIILIVFLISVYKCNGKIYTRCNLATELARMKAFQKIFLGNWVCLAEKVSNRNTSALVVSPSGKKSYGIYQIPSRWCREGKKGGECNIACESLLDDDIRDDTACAVTIFHKEGFKYWTKWESRCKNDKMITTEIYKCPGLMHRRLNPEDDAKSEVLRKKKKQSRVGITQLESLAVA